ncbi:MAG: hypothetical protein H0U74_07055 [Bradymonadaceae bacterium]|nr:hypothetical protein [Lujinxingiaceae bacterium]
MARESITTRLIEAIEGWDPLHGPLVWSDELFDELARAVFAHQYKHNAAYRGYCESSGVRPESLNTWRDLPAVPTDAFKYVRLSAAEQPVRTFRTSGTSADARGEHHFGTLDVYKAALHGPFVRFCLPEQRPIRMLVVAPSPDDLADSSLSFMLGELVARWGDAESGYFFGPGQSGAFEPDFEGLGRALDRAQADDVVTMVLGTAFGFIEFFDHNAGRWSLPAGSRVMETGGFKGRTRELTRAELYGLFEQRLGISTAMCVSEYSMTELSSQAYSDNLASGIQENVRLRVPPWARVEVVDPVSLRPLKGGTQRGLIRWIDLANVDSVCAVQTSDMGIVDEDGGFLLLGRAAEAELRGCSLTIEEIIAASTDKR